MSTLKIDELKNNGSAIDLPNGIKVGGNEIVQGYTSSGTEPASPAKGDFWWDSTNELLYQYVNGEFKEIGIVPPFTWTVSMSDVTYDNKSFAVTGNGQYNLDLGFNADGTKMYVLVFTTDRLYQYSLSTAWDVSTASYDSVSFSFSSQDSTPYSFTMTPDGTKIIMQGNANSSIFQYSLSTAFDLSTISYDSVSLSVSSSHLSNGKVRFGQNGEKMFLKGGNNVVQYSLSTAYDISTGSYDNVSFDVSSPVSSPIAFAFDLSGTKMYVTGLGNAKVHQYTLSTAFDISTASYDNVTLNYASQVSKGNAMVFSPSGHKFYLITDVNDTIYQYSTGL